MLPMNTTATENDNEILEILGRAMPHLRLLLKNEQPLHDLGLDSIDFVELLCTIEAEFQVSITETDLASSTTVGELAGLIADRRKARRKT